MKADLSIYRDVFMACGGPDPYAPEEPEYERTIALFWWLENWRELAGAGVGGVG